jgi:hypothetical protein
MFAEAMDESATGSVYFSFGLSPQKRPQRRRLAFVLVAATAAQLSPDHLGRLIKLAHDVAGDLRGNDS